MKNLVGRVVTSLLLSILALGSVAQGQRTERIIHANIPFDFAVGDRYFPAGHYSLVRSEPWQLELRDSEGRALVTRSDPIGRNLCRSRPTQAALRERRRPPRADPGLGGE